MYACMGQQQGTHDVHTIANVVGLDHRETAHLLDPLLHVHHVLVCEGPQGSTQCDLIGYDVVCIAALFCVVVCVSFAGGWVCCVF